MFGKGVYFADMVSKSANYCHTSYNSPTGLMLLCEVALGDMYELTGAEMITKLPAGKHSTFGECAWWGHQIASLHVRLRLAKRKKITNKKVKGCT